MLPIITLIKKWFGPKKAPKTTYTPHIVPQDQHHLNRQHISANAQLVLKTLNAGGYQAYLVGGCVRDILLNKHPKDFDIATNAHPEQIRKLFRNCRLIGRRFRLAHIFFGRDIIEVATFRAPSTGDDKEAHRQSQHGMLLRDNVYGTLEEDVWRRDFTVNALYYSGADASIVDFTEGLKDLAAKRLKLIGDPHQRYREDPVRMLRAIRFAGKLDFDIEDQTAAPIQELRLLLKNVSPARLFEEITKILLSGHSEKIIALLQKHHIFELLFPEIHRYLTPEYPLAKHLLTHATKNTDKRLQDNKTVNPAFLLAAILWYPLREMYQALCEKGQRPLAALHQATQDILKTQSEHMAIPKRLTLMMREIWLLQLRLVHTPANRATTHLAHPRFRAAYDFLLLRVTSGEAPELEPYVAWWTEFQTVTDLETANHLLTKFPRIKTNAPKARRSRRKRKS